MTSLRRIAPRFADAPLVAILIVVVALMAFANPGRFLSLGNLASLAYQLPMLAFLSFGMMISMLTGGINLAIVSSANLTGIVTALTLKALTGGDSASASLKTRARLYECLDCGRQTSVTAGTAMHRSKLPLTSGIPSFL